MVRPKRKDIFREANSTFPWDTPFVAGFIAYPLLWRSQRVVIHELLVL